MLSPALRMPPILLFELNSQSHPAPAFASRNLQGPFAAPPRLAGSLPTVWSTPPAPKTPLRPSLSAFRLPTAGTPRFVASPHPNSSVLVCVRSQARTSLRAVLPHPFHSTATARRGRILSPGQNTNHSRLRALAPPWHPAGTRSASHP